MRVLLFPTLVASECPSECNKVVIATQDLSTFFPSINIKLSAMWNVPYISVKTFQKLIFNYFDMKHMKQQLTCNESDRGYHQQRKCICKFCVENQVMGGMVFY